MVRRLAFTLVELLVVVGVIGLLIAILIPALSRARRQANSVNCLSNLRQIGQALTAYSSSHQGCIVPAYNIPPIPGQTDNFNVTVPIDGWAPILDGEKLLSAEQQSTSTVFYCPETTDIRVLNTDFGSDPVASRGWLDWPLQFYLGPGGPNNPVTIPDRGFTKIIRVSYWINAYAPTGQQLANMLPGDLFYTNSTGLGPDKQGNFLRLKKTSGIRRSSDLIVLADGIYTNSQNVTRPGDFQSRIGYRHPFTPQSRASSNVLFADGHCDSVPATKFPRLVNAGDPPAITAQRSAENLAGPTLYADPSRLQ